jgi:3-oxoadipate enol-lactonase
MATSQMKYTIEGEPDKPVLVLANSLAATSAMWDEQSAAWRGQWRLVRFDYAGHGDPEAADGSAAPATIDGIAEAVLALLDSLGVQQFSFVGLSLGGMLGLRLAAAAPDRVQRIVVANCRYHQTPELEQQWTDRIAAVRAGGMEAISAVTVERWLTQAYRQQRPDQAAKIGAMIRSTSKDGYAAAASAVRDFDARPWLERIKCPVLVISGAQDGAAPTAHLGVLASQLGAQHLVLDPCAHLSCIEQADAFTRGAGNFLA